MLKRLSCAIALSLLLLLNPIIVDAQTFVHPGIPFTTADLNQLKSNITQEPWLTAYNNFKNDSRSKLSYVMQGPFANVGRAPDINLNQWRSDMTAVHNLAFMWIFTADSAYARKATDIMDAWAVTNTIFSGGEMPLDLGDYVHYFVTGADILKSTFPNWTAANTAHVNSYFTNLVYPNANVPSPVKGLNQGALQLKIALSVAAFLDDSVRWNQSLDVYRTDAGGGLRCSLGNGQVGDAGRDQGHWFGEAASLCWGAEVAWKQGVDLFSELNNRLLAVSELYTKFNIDTTGLYGNFIPFGGYYGYYTSYGATGGARSQSFMYNIINNAYNTRKGIPTPNTDAYNNIVGENTLTFLYRKSSDASTATPLPTLAYPTTEDATTLTNVDIGNVGIAGSANFSGGTWTVKGAGNSVADVFNFTGKPVWGDATIVARVTGNTASNPVSGLMIRTSLAAGSNYVALNLTKSGGANLSSRGMGASNAGTHSQPRTPWWFKLERFNGRVTAYHSVDGVNWTCIAAYISTLPDTLYLGLYTVSNNTSTLNTATFTNVGITNPSAVGSPSINSATAASAIVGTAFSYATTATNTPTSYSASGLPAGLAIDAVTGVISGTPTTTGKFMVTLNATNTNGTGKALLIIQISNNTAPAAPTGLTASIVNVSNISLSWAASTNANSYSVKRSTTAGGPYTTIATGVTNVNFIDASPVPEVNNYYVVTALAGSLESGNSNEAVNKVPPAIPAKPVVVALSTELDLSWPIASGAASYNVKRSTSLGGPYTTIANVSTNSYNDLAVTSGSPYYYVVSSVGSTQESGNSAEAFGVPGSTSVTWAETPVSETWNQPSNWIEGYVPVSPAIVTFRSTTDSVLTNDIINLNVSRILFDTTAASYTINGNSLVLNNDFINSSPSAQIINNPLVLNNQIAINNGGDITMNGLVSGSGGLVKTGAGLLYMNNGGNTYTGNTVISGSAGGFPPSNGIGIGGSGSGTSGAPTSGTLGTGTIIMNGGGLFSAGGGNAYLYNNVVIANGTSSYFYQSNGGLYLAGKLSGGGTVTNDGNTPGLHLLGDNSGFTGYFRSLNRSSNHRIRFDNAASGSANAAWDFNNSFTDGQGLAFGAGTINFGAMSGNGAIRNDAGTASTISIGALGTNTSFGGIISGSISIVKVGTGTLIFGGNNTYTGTTTIQLGKFLLNNNATNGTFVSAVTAVGGAFGGTGLSTASVTIGTGSGTGATFEPGNQQAIGTITIGLLTMNSDATYKVELNPPTSTCDNVNASGVVLNSPQLAITALTPDALTVGTSFTIINNTGSSSVVGTFNGLPEFSTVTINGNLYHISYIGGTGNDVVLLDDRTVNHTAQTITFPALSAVTTATADFDPGATASSGLQVTYTSSNTAVATIVTNMVHIVGAGNAVITAQQDGNSTYAPAPNVTRLLTVSNIAVGDYVSLGTINWNGGTWNISDGNGGYSGTTITPPTSANNVTIKSGSTVTVSTTAAVFKNLTVESGATVIQSIGMTASGTTVMNGTLTSSNTYTANGDLTIAGTWTLGTINSAGNVTINPSGILKGTTTAGSSVQSLNFGGVSPTITIDGQLGGPSAGGSGESIRVYPTGSGTTTFTGAGKVFLARFQPNLNGAQNIVVDINMNFNTNQSGSTGFSLQNNGATTSAKTLTINAGKTVTLSNSGCGFLNVANSTSGSNTNLGDMTFNVNGTLDVSVGHFVFYSSTSTTSPTPQQNLILNIGSTGVLKLGSNVRMAKSLAGQTVAINVANGGVIDGSAAPLNFTTTPVASNGTSAANKVWFTLSPGAIYKRSVTASVAAPLWVGYSNYSYTPVTVTPTTATVFTVGMDTATSITMENVNYALNKIWKITPTTSSSTTLGFGYNATDANSSCNPSSAMYLKHYNTTTSVWENAGNATPVVGSLNDYTATFTGINSFSPFTLSNNVGVLTLKKLSFTAEKMATNVVSLKWETEQEFDVQSFIIEHSLDGVNYRQLTVVSAKNGQLNNYAYVDMQPIEGSNYYRIKAMDIDGQHTYSQVKVVSLSNSNAVWSIYPNPIIGNTINLHSSNLAKGNYNLMLLDNAGKQVALKTIEHLGGNGSYSIPLNGTIAKGIYMLEVNGASTKQILKIMIR